MKRIPLDDLIEGNKYILIHRNKNNVVDEMYEVEYIGGYRDNDKLYATILKVYKMTKKYVERKKGDIVDIIDSSSGNVDEFYEINDGNLDELMAILL
jgi:hypothetical protein